MSKQWREGEVDSGEGGGGWPDSPMIKSQCPISGRVSAAAASQWKCPRGLEKWKWTLWSESTRNRFNKAWKCWWQNILAEAQFGVLTIWRVDNLAVWLFGCLTIWRFDYLAVWLFGGLTLWRFDYLAVWLFGGLIIWRFYNLVILQFGSFTIWQLDYFVPWLS